EHNDGSASHGQLTPIPRFRQERHRLAVRIRKRPDTLNERVGIAAKLTAKSSSEFPERYGHVAAPAVKKPPRQASGSRRTYLPGGFAGAGGAAAGAAAFGRAAAAPGFACNWARMAGVMSIVGVV